MEFSHKVLGKTDRIRTVTSELSKLVPFIVLTLFMLVLCSCVPSAQAEGWPGVSWHNGILYTASRDGSIMAINSSARSQNLTFPQTESGEWSYRVEVRVGGLSCGPSSVPATIYSAPLATGDLVYACVYNNGDVLAMSPSARSQNLTFPHRGSGEWSEFLPGNIVGSPVIDGNIVYLASSDGRIYALNATHGDPEGKSVLLGDKLWTAPEVGEDTIYVSTFGGCVCALSTKGFSPAEDVRPFWTFKADVGFVSSPVLYKDTIFVGSFDNNLYAIKVEGSEPMWNFTGDNWFWAAPVINEGVVYAGCLDGKVYALDAETGDELWEFDTESRIATSPVMEDDLLVVACDSGEVYILRTDIVVDERLVSAPISFDASIRGSICAQDGMAYIRAENDCLYAVDVHEGKISWEFPLTTE